MKFMRMGVMFLVLLMLAGLFLMTIKPVYIGRILSEGGNVTALNIDFSGGNVVWIGVYGDFGLGPTQRTFIGTSNTVIFLFHSLFWLQKTLNTTAR